MKKTKLKPYVHKIKGAKNYGLYDLLKGKFYLLDPGCESAEIRKSLKEAGLTFETEGTVPMKISLDLTKEKNTINLRKLQVRLNGNNENNCWSREITGTKKRRLPGSLLTILYDEIRDIAIGHIRIEAEVEDREAIAFILGNFGYETAAIFVQEKLTGRGEKYYHSICAKRGKTLKILETGKKDPRELKLSVYDFFHNQAFNPCLGRQIAIDCGGEIKPCLWWRKEVGRLGVDNLKDLIIGQVFDPYWQLTKDKIEVCKVCEYRYGCQDCRVSHCQTGNDLMKKPSYCHYDPFSGKAPGGTGDCL